MFCAVEIHPLVNAILKRNFTALQPTEHSVELRQRVERLEQLRIDACTHRARETVDLIDKQIEHAIVEWRDSFVVDIEEREFRKTA